MQLKHKATGVGVRDSETVRDRMTEVYILLLFSRSDEPADCSLLISNKAMFC